MSAVQAELSPERPLGLGGLLLERDQGEVIGVEVDRVLVPVAREEVGRVGAQIGPLLAGDHAGPATDTAGVVLEHPHLGH